MTKSVALMTLATLVMMSSGCTGLHSRVLANQSAGSIACHPDQISTFHDKQRLGSQTWIATCNGTNYLCSRTGEGHIACSPTSGS